MLVREVGGKKTAEELWGMTTKELKEYARLVGYSTITKLRKREMIYAILRQQEKERGQG
jgi:transcription termination factor Rho